jgi:site-specific recombinase XerD
MVISENETRIFPTTAAERYDKALRLSLKRHPAPAGLVVPKPTSAWPEENVDFLERYRDWLTAGGYSTEVISQHRIPVAGYMLGLALKPYNQLCLDTDTERTRMYICAKSKGKVWETNCTHSLRWFRQFLEQERGLVKITLPKYGNIARFQAGLPCWLIKQLTKLLHIRQANWQPSRIAQSTYRYWYVMTRVWRWLYEHEIMQEDDITAIRRTDLDDYIDEMLVAGYNSKSINLDLHQFQSTLRFLEQNGRKIPRWLLVMPTLKTPDTLPRFLSDTQVGQVKENLKQRVLNAKTTVQQRDSRLDLALFYLLWQSGMRVSELEDLSLEDLHLPEKQVTIREAKGLKDRTVYLTEATAEAIADYVKVRGPALSDHLFI